MKLASYDEYPWLSQQVRPASFLWDRVRTLAPRELGGVDTTYPRSRPPCTPSTSPVPFFNILRRSTSLSVDETSNGLGLGLGFGIRTNLRSGSGSGVGFGLPFVFESEVGLKTGFVTSEPRETLLCYPTASFFLDRCGVQRRERKVFYFHYFHHHITIVAVVEPSDSPGEVRNKSGLFNFPFPSPVPENPLLRRLTSVVKSVNEVLRVANRVAQWDVQLLLVGPRPPFSDLVTSDDLRNKSSQFLSNRPRRVK